MLVSQSVAPFPGIFSSDVVFCYYLSKDCLSYSFYPKGYDHLCNDPAMMYRVETMPGLGWWVSSLLPVEGAYFSLMEIW